MKVCLIDSLTSASNVQSSIRLKFAEFQPPERFVNKSLKKN